MVLCNKFWMHCSLISPHSLEWLVFLSQQKSLVGIRMNLHQLSRSALNIVLWTEVRLSPVQITEKMARWLLSKVIINWWCLQNVRGDRPYTEEELSSCIINKKPGCPDLVKGLAYFYGPTFHQRTFYNLSFRSEEL